MPETTRAMSQAIRRRTRLRPPSGLLAALASALLVLGCGSSSAQAPRDAAGAGATAKPDPRVAIAQKLEVPVDAVRPSLIPGLYEVVHDAEVLYAAADGRYVIAGDLFDLDRKTNLSEQRRATARADVLKGVTDADAIVFGPKDAKYTIDVFTDVDCGYCRKLHSEIAEYNRLGIRVRYLFYPRSGPGSDSWQKAINVWCSPNRQDALTHAKLGEPIKAPACRSNPVEKTWKMGRELQVRGTPGIFTERGDYIAGYLPPARMLERLQQLEPPASGGTG